MKIARVIGSVVNSVKTDSLEGHKLMWVEPVDGEGRRSEPAVLAVDAAQAGLGDFVLLCQEGKSARMLMDSSTAPVEAVIVGVIDYLEIHGKSVTLPKKGEESP